MGAETPFPNREEAEEHYTLSPEYRKLFERVLRYAREKVQDDTAGGVRQRESAGGRPSPSCAS
jgi:hypothetical protein